MEALATKYRPHDWDSVTEQASIKIILEQQLENNEIKHAYLFCGGAGTGKTTCARIFANEINHGHGNPIEMDAASHNGVDDVRDIIQQAKTKSIDSEYKCFIIDECHSISNTGWQAFLKIIEEPPAKSIFIFCTTDPQKIPKTILSRVQRYDFQRISQDGIVGRLHWILEQEFCANDEHIVNDVDEALIYISKLSAGGMRDAITMMDKCLSYSDELTLENVIQALGVPSYDTLKELVDDIITGELGEAVKVIEEVHSSGKDLKQFVRTFMEFVLDINKYNILHSFDYLQVPATEENVDWFNSLEDNDMEACGKLLECLMKLMTSIKYSQSPKYDIEATLLVEFS